MKKQTKKLTKKQMHVLRKAVAKTVKEYGETLRLLGRDDFDKTPKPGLDFIGVSAGAMIFNDKGEIFLSKRSKNASNEKGHWETPGGRVEFGETLEKAVKREIKEEYGVDIILVNQFPAANHIIPKENQHWIATTFLAKIKKNQTPKIMEPNKCDAIGFFKLNSLPKPLSIITKIDLKTFNKLHRK